MSGAAAAPLGPDVEPAPAWLDELGFEPGPPWHAMGTRALVEDRWLLVDERRTDELARKRALLDTAHDVVSATLSGDAARDAAGEAADVVAAAAGRPLDPTLPPLEAAALVVQEDLCVLVPDAGGWRLAAGVVCFPSMWRLPDKVGLHLTGVHGPVPAYASELATRVDRFLDRLRPERPVWRRNWLLHDSPELHVPDPPPAHGAPVVPDDLWLRSERQALRRLPRTGAVLFTIRTQQAPLACLASRPDVASAMAGAVRAWSDDLVAYRGAASWRAPALSWLDQVAVTAGAG